MTGRVPILPPFHANNQLSKTPIPDLPVSSMFDLARMNREMVNLRGVLEWEDIQTDKGVSEPEVGCWGGIRKNNALDFAKISESCSYFRSVRTDGGLAEVEKGVVELSNGSRGQGS